MMRVVVIGGGIAGLAAAVELGAADCRVTLLEQRRVLGGRAYSLIDTTTGDAVDNGQHLFIDGFAATRRFLEAIGSADRIEFQRRFEIDFARPGAGLARWAAPDWPFPWNLAAALLRFPLIPWTDRGRALFGARQLARMLAQPPPAAQHVEEWLAALEQPESVRAALWRPLALAALNQDPDRAAATQFVTVLRESFGRGAAHLGTATVGLSDLFAEPAARTIEAQSGRIQCGCPAQTLALAGDRVTAVITRDRDAIAADAVIAAVPPPALQRLLPETLTRAPWCEALPVYQPEPILSLNLWLDRAVTDQPFVGLIGTRMQWLFNKDRIMHRVPGERHAIALVISSAQDWIGRPQADLVALAQQELATLFPAARGARVLHARVMKEPEATWSLPRWTTLRPLGAETPIRNLFLAGDWTDTGLPATVESAVRSGVTAARRVVDLN